MKRLTAIVLLFVLALSLLAGCGSKLLTSDDAQKVALKDLGIKEKDADSIHVHVGTAAEGPAYQIHVEYQGQTYEYMILAATGEILSTGTVQGH